MKGKNEGFTLVELIIVIAIIVILTTLLVPSVLGYIRRANITAMNANAKSIHTAVSAAMVNLAVSGVNLPANPNSPGTPIRQNAKASNMYIAAYDSSTDKIQVVFRMNGNLVVVGNTSLGLTDKADMVSYLGKGFNGNVIAYINPRTHSVDCLVYAERDKSYLGTQAGWLSAGYHRELSRANTHIENDANGNLVNKITADAQEEDAKNGYLYGVYPQAMDSGSGS